MGRQRRVGDPLALKLIQAEVREGDHVVVDSTGELSFGVVETAVGAKAIPT